MKTLYTVHARWFNGTVTMVNDISSYYSLELAEKVKAKIETVNKDDTFPCLVTIEQTPVFENENEVPILNKK